MPAFKKGDRVAWHHGYAAQHAEGSVVRADAVPEGGLLGVGTVEGPANEEGTWFEVSLDGEKEPRVLTEDELVRIKETA